MWSPCLRHRTVFFHLVFRLSGNEMLYTTLLPCNARQHTLTINCLRLGESDFDIIPVIVSSRRSLTPLPPALMQRLSVLRFPIRTRVMGSWPDLHGNRCISLGRRRAVMLALSAGFTADYMFHIPDMSFWLKMQPLNSPSSIRINYRMEHNSFLSHEYSTCTRRSSPLDAVTRNWIAYGKWRILCRRCILALLTLGALVSSADLYPG